MASCLNEKEKEFFGVGRVNGPKSIVILGSGYVVDKVKSLNKAR